MPEGTGGEGGEPRGAGLLDSLTSLARSLIAIGQTRLQIIGNELEEQRAILLRELLLAVTAAFCIGLSALFVAVFFVILFWDEHRLLVVGLFACLFIVASVAVILVQRMLSRERPRMFAITDEELEKDKESLQ